MGTKVFLIERKIAFEKAGDLATVIINSKLENPSIHTYDLPKRIELMAKNSGQLQFATRERKVIARISFSGNSGAKFKIEIESKNPAELIRFSGLFASFLKSAKIDFSEAQN